MYRVNPVLKQRKPGIQAVKCDNCWECEYPHTTVYRVLQVINIIRMHSSRMHTAHTLLYRGLPYWDFPGQRHPWTETPHGQRPLGQRPSWTETPLDRDTPVNRTAHRCKIITFPQLHCGSSELPMWFTVFFWNMGGVACILIRSHTKISLACKAHSRVDRPYHVEAGILSGTEIRKRAIKVKFFTLWYFVKHQFYFSLQCSLQINVPVIRNECFLHIL